MAKRSRPQCGRHGVNGQNVRRGKGEGGGQDALPRKAARLARSPKTTRSVPQPKHAQTRLPCRGAPSLTLFLRLVRPTRSCLCSSSHPSSVLLSSRLPPCRRSASGIRLRQRTPTDLPRRPRNSRRASPRLKRRLRQLPSLPKSLLSLRVGVDLLLAAPRTLMTATTLTTLTSTTSGIGTFSPKARRNSRYVSLSAPVCGRCVTFGECADP